MAANQPKPPLSIHQLALLATPVAVSQSALLVYLPFLVSRSPLDYSGWGQVFALGMGFYLLGALAWPLLLPKLGYRPIALLGLGGFAGSQLLLLGFVWSWQQQWISAEITVFGLALSRVVYGLLSSALLPLSQTAAAQLSKPEQRLASFSRVSLYLALGRGLGPVLTLLALGIHWAAPLLLLLALPGFVFSQIAGRGYPPRLTAEAGRAEGSLSVQAIGLRHYYPLLGMAAAATAFASSLQFLAAPTLQQLSNGDASEVSRWIGYTMVTAALLGALAHSLQAKLTNPTPQRRMLLITLLLAICGGALWLGLHLWQFLWVVAMASMGLAWLTPLYSSQLSLRQPAFHRLSAQLNTSHLLGHIVGLAVCAPLLATDLADAYLWLATLGCLMLVTSVAWPVPGQGR